MITTISENSQKLTSRESVALFILKAFAILSVIAAHTVVVDESNTINDFITSAWVIFGRVGVVIFFITGGFLYHRTDGDNKQYWKKKFFRIIIPWIICSCITFGISIIGGNNLSLLSFIKWIFGYGTWYYYIVMYMLFLFIFKFFYKHNWVLYTLMAINVIALILKVAPLSFMTVRWGVFDYLNPLFWVGYFSLGIIIRKYGLHTKLTNITSFIVGIISLMLTFTLVYKFDVFTFFHPFTMLNCLAFALVLFNISYYLANKNVRKYLKPIGTSTYCIYLLHMQIVQSAMNLIPNGLIKYIFAPFLGLAIMMLLITVANWICKKLPFGDNLKMCFGL